MMSQFNIFIYEFIARHPGCCTSVKKLSTTTLPGRIIKFSLHETIVKRFLLSSCFTMRLLIASSTYIWLSRISTCMYMYNEYIYTVNIPPP